MYFLSFLIVSVVGQNCYSNYEATFCPLPACCTRDGFCGTYDSECVYFASHYSCSFADCEYCCYNTGYSVECGTKQDCMTWIVVGISCWFVFTIAVVFMVINRKRSTVLRMIMIEEQAQRAHQEAIQARMMYEKQEEISNEEVVKSDEIKKEEEIIEHIDGGPQPKSLEDDDPLDYTQDVARMDQTRIKQQYNNIEL